MPYQTVTSPCYSCIKGNCISCEFSLITPASLKATVSHINDAFIENLWRECEDIAWIENTDGELVLDQPWRGFPVGEFTQDAWFYWVDTHHSKGVGWVYENISPYDFRKGDE